MLKAMIVLRKGVKAWPHVLNEPIKPETCATFKIQSSFQLSIASPDAWHKNGGKRKKKPKHKYNLMTR